MERPSIAGRITTLADFGSLTFIDCSATIEEVKETVRGFSGYQLVMYNDGPQLVEVSPLNADGLRFKVDNLWSSGNQPHLTSFK